LLFALDALTGALFLLTALGVVATRQVLASLQLYQKKRRMKDNILLSFSAKTLVSASIFVDVTGPKSTCCAWAFPAKCSAGTMSACATAA
jgi:hypothetical protein